MITALAGLGLLGVATRLAGSDSHHESNARSQFSEAKSLLRGSKEMLRRGNCRAAARLLRQANWVGGKATAHFQSSEVALRELPDSFFEVFSGTEQVKSLINEHCIRSSPVKRDVLMTALRSGDLSGATKVCISYKRGPSGKVRCAQWSSGPGYTPGPHEEGTYRIQDVRDFFARQLCADPRNKKKCGLSRKYRYRRSLPYLPRGVADRNAAVPRVARSGVVKIIVLGPAPALRRERSRR